MESASVMNSMAPLVSVGLPVHNGENYIVGAIESILNQTYRNIELIISDNASTDNTGGICQKYTLIDNRVKYYRLNDNCGAMVNHNRVLDLAKGKYFQWICHDDECEQTYIQKCVGILEENEQIICCFSVIKFIDGKDNVLRLSKNELSIFDDSRLERMKKFVDLQKASVDIFCAMYGLFRTASIKKLGPLGTYIAGDQVYLLKMVFDGKLYQLNDPYLSRREHPSTALIALPKLPHYKKYKEATRWGEAKCNPMIVLVNWKLMKEAFSYFSRYPMRILEKMKCFTVLFRLFIARWRRLLKELMMIPGQLVYHFVEK